MSLLHEVCETYMCATLILATLLVPSPVPNTACRTLAGAPELASCCVVVVEEGRQESRVG